MPYDNVPTDNAPALAPRIDEYLFEIDLAGTHPDGNPRSTLDDLDLFSPDGGKSNTDLLNYLDRVVTKVTLRGETLLTRKTIKEEYEEDGETKTRERVEEYIEGVRGKNIPYPVLKRLMQGVNTAIQKANNAKN